MPEVVLGQEQFPIDQAAINLVRGRELLIDRYGYWPAFIDVEVIRVSLERAPTSYTATSNLRAVFYTFDIHKAPDDLLRKQAHTEMLFGEVMGLKLSGWSHQTPSRASQSQKSDPIPLDVNCSESSGVASGAASVTKRISCAPASVWLM